MLGSYALGEHALGSYDVIPRIVADAGAFTLTGRGLNVALPAATGTFAATGVDASAAFNFPASTGAFTASGASGLKRALVLHAGPDQPVPTPNHFLFAPLGFRALGAGTQESPPATTFALSGKNVEFAIRVTLTAERGAFTLAGQAAILAYVGYPPKIRVFPSVGRGARGVSRGTEPIRVFASTGHGTRRRAFGG
jgi:hypothetical protein